MSIPHFSGKYDSLNRIYRVCSLAKVVGEIAGLSSKAYYLNDHRWLQPFEAEAPDVALSQLYPIGSMSLNKNRSGDKN